MIETINPTTGETLGAWEEHSETEVAAALDEAARAQPLWLARSYDDRAARLTEAAEVLRARRRELAELMAREMGKPLEQGRSEVDKCAWVCDYYAENGASFLSNVEIESDAGHSYLAFRPLGVVLAVMPWNFPLWQVFRFAAPTLMAGNVGLLKHATNVPGCAEAIEEIFRQAGFPEGVFRNLRIERQRVGAVIEHPSCHAVTLTGSVGAGRAVASLAGKALKKTVLELGGSDPYLVLDDADLELAVEACVTSRLINSGQSCIAAKRFLVVKAVRREFEIRFEAAMASRRVGDPLDPATDVGPQARRDLRDDLHDQVEASVAAGAGLLSGGELPNRAGAFYPPTVLTDVAPGMPAFDEELFGPVAAIVPVADEDEAVELANASAFGLGAAVFSGDPERAEVIARERLDAGACFVNDFVRSDPRLPFGGIKASGYGRELSRLGIREFVNAKTVWIR